MSDLKSPKEFDGISQIDANFIFKLLVQYNEQTRKIVEDLIGEVRNVHKGSENLSILDNRIAAIEIKLKEVVNDCKMCSAVMRKYIEDIKENQIENQEKFHDFEKEALKEHTAIKNDLLSSREKKFDELKERYDELKDRIAVFDRDSAGKYFDLDKKISVNIAKISTVIVVVLSILKFIGEKLLEHIMHLKP